MARRWSGLVVLVVTALTFYLISSDRYPEQGLHRPATAHVATVSSDVAQDHSPQPSITSDGLTLQPRAFVLPPASEHDVPTPLWTALILASALRRPRRRPLLWRILTVLQPRLEALQVLRC
ncbi:hypothetical protein [Dactylosporangium sp. NPDC050588]|uniref:hypothetical protein n=1 Tax=Dactylosporangium sp. NPDC050588 TaxID=3157211 RepID=UPI00340B621C